MKKIVYIVITSLLFSCSSLQQVKQSDLVGEFFKRETAKGTLSISYDLALKSDNTFSLSIKMQDANPKCIGKWELKGEYIYLECEGGEDIGNVLSSGYMKEKKYKIEVINKNKIKLKSSILKRK